MNLELPKSEVHKRRWDLSSVGGLNAFPGRRKFVLERGRLLYGPGEPAGYGGVVVPTGLRRPTNKGVEDPVPAGDPKAGGADGEVGPLVKVLRCRDDGVHVSALFRDGQGLFVQDDRGRRRRSTGLNILDAISRSASLRDVRADEATMVILGPGAPAEEAVALRLRLLDQDKLADEEPVTFDAQGLPAPEAKLAEVLRNDMTPIEGISGRGIVINGHRWIASCPQDGLAPRLWPQDPGSEDLRPRVLETFVHISVVERGSRTSGYDVFEIGSLSEDVAYLLQEPDELPTRIYLRRRVPSRRPEEEAARWLLTPSGMLGEVPEVTGIDLVALAVETLIGLGQDEDAVPATILGGESDTLMCSFRLFGDRDEFLAQIRRLGRGDVIDAVETRDG